MQVWLPTIRAGSGSDVFAERLAAGLNAAGVKASITWFPHWYEIAPWLMHNVQPPPGTDIIHTNTSYAFAFKRPGTRLVATELHHLLDPAFRPFKSLVQHTYQKYVIGPYLRRSYAQADAITAISEFTAKVLADEAGVSVTATVPLWVDADMFKPGPTRAPATDNQFRLLFIGNNSKRKGADVIPLLAQLLGAGFQIRCTAGLRQQSAAHHLPNVKILGRLSEPDLATEYQQCDAVLVPSRYEGFGYAALEAMATGKPVVGFRSGAVAEVVGEAGSILLREIDDVLGLAEACVNLASNPAIAYRTGVDGRRRAHEAYAQETAIARYISLYQRLVAEPSGHRQPAR